MIWVIGDVEIEVIVVTGAIEVNAREVVVVVVVDEVEETNGRCVEWAGLL